MSRRWWPGRLDRDRGSAALTTAIFVPVALMLIGLTIACGRVALAEGAADAAARDAARTASLADDPASGAADARQAAQTSLANSGIRCAGISVQLDTSGLAAPAGQAASVTATVSCTAPLSELALPGVAGSKTLTSTKTSVVDTWATRSGT
ncbi:MULTISPECIES: TadE/TadG family type IV pilus assembly protein [Streptomyces]|uniref:TadE/TadG family type IV pilus assembly protein n=1 Tax=Streptomyces TaxID=1883 RepID=UPI00118163AF|nr:TadE/TadG family type IV pilus assembly protein [Streptomyces sp. IB201691-2A2]TRO57045.1 pilus assembly protein [Streptomyces sp. IB201691-2A2]